MPLRKTHAAKITIVDRKFTLAFRINLEGNITNPQIQTYCGLYVGVGRLETGDRIECVSCLGQAKIHNPLKIDIQTDSITISTINDSIEVVHFEKDEWIEDPTIIPAIAEAINLAHTDPGGLITINAHHMYSEYELSDDRIDEMAEHFANSFQNFIVERGSHVKS